MGIIRGVDDEPDHHAERRCHRGKKEFHPFWGIARLIIRTLSVEVTTNDTLR